MRPRDYKTPRGRAGHAARLLLARRPAALGDDASGLGREFDACFENGDGGAVLDLLLARAVAAPDLLAALRTHRLTDWAARAEALRDLGGAPGTVSEIEGGTRRARVERTLAVDGTATYRTHRAARTYSGAWSYGDGITEHEGEAAAHLAAETWIRDGGAEPHRVEATEPRPTYSRRPRREGEDGPDDDFDLLADGEPIGGTYRTHPHGKPDGYASFGPAATRMHFGSREAAEAVQIRAHQEGVPDLARRHKAAGLRLMGHRLPNLYTVETHDGEVVAEGITAREAADRLDTPRPTPQPVRATQLNAEAPLFGSVMQIEMF